MLALFWPGLAFVAATVAALVLRSLILAAVERWRRGPDGDGTLGAALRTPSLLWSVVLGLYVAFEVADLPARARGPLWTVLEVAVILSVTFTLASVVGTLIGRASERRALGGPVSGLAQTAARVAVLIVGFLVVLGALGIQITPLLTALGVGGLAVALALQDTLANLFAGVHLLADRPIRVGDHVKVGDAAEGFVLDVGWRSTRIRSLQNNVIFVPNQVVARSTITNYGLPEPATVVSLKVGVDYAVDPDRVEAVLVEEATRAAGELPGLLPAPAPHVLLTRFGEYALEFTLVCRVANSGDEAGVQHGLRKRILRRFRAEGVAMPFPVRTVRLEGAGEGGRSGDTGPLPHA